MPSELCASLRLDGKGFSFSPGRACFLVENVLKENDVLISDIGRGVACFGQTIRYGSAGVGGGLGEPNGSFAQRITCQADGFGAGLANC